jgi:ADP-ribose pyrophosphatase YjhB (NUDIX family)
LLLNFIANIWNSLGKSPRHAILWLLHGKFLHGVTGVILDKQGRILLLKHRFWTRQQWGLPGGLAARGETLAATLRRELREETGLEVRPSALLRVRAAGGIMAEFFLLAESTGEPRANPPEILEARFWDRTQLPENMLPSHRNMLEAILASEDWTGLPLDE